jgi:hypothetical protein
VSAPALRLCGIAIAAVLAACQAPASPGGSGGPNPGGSAGSTHGSGIPGSPAIPTAGVSVPAEIDASLLDYLPTSVGDAVVEENIEEAAIAISDPTLSRIATAVDVGVALEQSSGNLVAAHVVRLREGAFDDAVYRQWRDTFDEGACAAARGVEGRAETTIDDRAVFVTTCVAKLRTYHVWIEDEDLLISASTVGPDRFGELLMQNLRVQE